MSSSKGFESLEGKPKKSLLKSIFAQSRLRTRSDGNLAFPLGDSDSSDEEHYGAEKSSTDISTGVEGKLLEVRTQEWKKSRSKKKEDPEKKMGHSRSNSLPTALAAIKRTFSRQKEAAAEFAVETLEAKFTEEEREQELAHGVLVTDILRDPALLSPKNEDHEKLGDEKRYFRNHENDSEVLQHDRAHINSAKGRKKSSNETATNAKGNFTTKTPEALVADTPPLNQSPDVLTDDAITYVDAGFSEPTSPTSAAYPRYI
eukprot:GEZU01017591.1.p1 GENE.GEZU01017591.1~~GEZU01017591.1.p1  ORF type:complete len:280 (+),score=41.66 GEZU01017591.1:66-842(+)